MRRVPQSYRNGELVIVIDCGDLGRSARFWCAVLGYTAVPSPSGRYRSLVPDSGQGVEVLLQRVDDGKLAKNRLHLDLRTGDLATEVGRIAALGASVLTEQPISEEGWRWHILADPDGNEFCILQPPGLSLSWQRLPAKHYQKELAELAASTAGPLHAAIAELRARHDIEQLTP